MTRVLYLDCLSGISGDMTLGALVDLGASVDAIQAAVRSMGLPDVCITAGEVKKKGFRAIKVDITHPPEHAHRHLHHIEAMIDAGGKISDEAKQLAKQIFHVVAVAEAKVHGTTVQKVHFHEVGAIDSIADIVGTAVAIKQLGIQSVVCSAVPTGTGEVTIAHGRVSIPAPATAEILCGVPIADCDVRAELTTPTGAAIVKSMAQSFGGLPAMMIERVGYGAGTKDLPEQANVLRTYLGQMDDSQRTALGDTEFDQVFVLETNLDDCPAQQISDACERLFDSGALDVFQTPCTMKKGRSGVLLTAVCTASRLEQMERIIFAHTTSIGIRRYKCDRSKLKRHAETVETALGPVRGKVVTLPGGKRRFAVEHDDASQIARMNQCSIAEVRRVGESVWLNQSHSEQ